MTDIEKGFESWAIVELMGHSVIAGYVTEQSIAGSAMLRVDVPKVDNHEPFTKFFGGSAIYGITPTTEELAKSAAKRLAVRPVSLWVVPQDRQMKIEYEDEPEPDDTEEVPY